MRFRTVGYLFREASDGIRKNSVMSFASVSSVALSLFILAVFLGLAVNVQNISRSVKSQVRVVAFLDEGFDRSQRDTFSLSLGTIDGVTEVGFVTKEEALERLRKQFGEQATLLEAVEENNPLRDSFEIQVPDPEKVDGVVRTLNGMSGISKVVYQEETVRRLRRVTGAIRALGLVLAAFLAVGTVFLIANTIRVSVFSRRREIGIMKLVGATDGFIRWPFFIEGAVLGSIGAVLASLALWLAYIWFADKISSSLPFVPVVPVQPFISNMAKGLVVLGMGLGAVGSVVSVRRHLRV